jgi:hypothetical protein
MPLPTISDYILGLVSRIDQTWRLWWKCKFPKRTYLTSIVDERPNSVNATTNKIGSIINVLLTNQNTNPSMYSEAIAMVEERRSITEHQITLLLAMLSKQSGAQQTVIVGRKHP